MIDTYRQLIINQFEAALSTLNACVERCPEAAWQAPVASMTFDQVAFHTLFYTDMYLGRSADGFRGQPFHVNNPDIFRDYEELQPRAQVLHYEKPQIRAYLRHCRDKVREVIAAETAESLAARADFPRREFSRAELHVYSIRHIQHHAACLNLRLRLDFEEDLPWFGSGWRELETAGS